MSNKKKSKIALNTHAGKEQMTNINNEPSATKKYFTGDRKLILLLTIVSLIVYANTFKNDYVLDDYTVIVKNTIVTKGITAIPEILSTPYHYGFSHLQNDLYRPLSLVMYAIEYQMFGPMPSEGHLINILLFSGCVIVLFVFLNNLFEKKKTAVAFIACLLFAVHPIHTEVVANIKSRDELLCFFFCFLSVNFFIKYMSSSKMIFLTAGAFCVFLSLLAKETSATFILLVPFIFFFYRNENTKRSIYITSISFVVFLFYLAIRFSVLKAYHSNNLANTDFIDNILVRSPSFASHMATCVLVLGYYIKLLFIPYPLLCDYSYDSIPFAHVHDIKVIISLFVYAFLIIYGTKRFIKNNKDPLAFGIVFFLVTISLFSNIPFIIGALMAERFVFFASAGFCVVLALLIERLLEIFSIPNDQLLKNRTVWVSLLPLVFIWGGMTISRNEDWLTNYTLYSADIKKCPVNSRLYQYLGNALAVHISTEEQNAEQKKHIITEGITNLQKAISIYPDFAQAQVDIGYAFFMVGQLDSADVHDKKALALDPNNIIALDNLAGVYFMRNNYEDAMNLCRKAKILDPDNANNLQNIGRCYLRLKQYDSVIILFKEAIVKDPANHLFNEGLAIAYKALGNSDSAQKYEQLTKQSSQ